MVSDVGDLRSSVFIGDLILFFFFFCISVGFYEHNNRPCN